MCLSSKRPREKAIEYPIVSFTHFKCIYEFNVTHYKTMYSRTRFMSAPPSLPVSDHFFPPISRWCREMRTTTCTRKRGGSRRCNRLLFIQTFYAKAIHFHTAPSTASVASLSLVLVVWQIHWYLAARQCYRLLNALYGALKWQVQKDWSSTVVSRASQFNVTLLLLLSLSLSFFTRLFSMIVTCDLWCALVTTIRSPAAQLSCMIALNEFKRNAKTIKCEAANGRNRRKKNRFGGWHRSWTRWSNRRTKCLRLLDTPLSLRPLCWGISQYDILHSFINSQDKTPKKDMIDSIIFRWIFFAMLVLCRSNCLPKHFRRHSHSLYLQIEICKMDMSDTRTQLRYDT